MRRTAIRMTLGALLAAVGCGGDTPTRAGGASPPITLTALAAATPGSPGGDQLVDFADRVTTLSDGKITIDVLDSAATEREAVESVQDGTADIGVVPARIFDTMDVTTLRALQAPFLIDSNALADAVLADPLAGEMLAGLDDVGLTGLALTFDSLRHPVGTTEPLLEPADFDGAVIAMLPGVTQQADYTALGAEVTHVVDAELTVGIAQGTIQGRDGSMQVPVGATTGPITGNAVIYLKAQAVVADSATFDGLTPEQQDVLRQAAAGTRDWASAQHTPLADAASAYCADGLGDVVLASDDQLAALRSAVEPVYAELYEDEFTQAAIERIEELKASISAGPPVAGCASATMGSAECMSATDPEIAASTDDQTAVDGIWRWEVTLDPNADRPGAAQQAALNNGTWTIEFHDGHRLITESYGGIRHFGTYVLAGDRIYIVDDDGVEGVAIWHRDGDTMTWAAAPECVDPVDAELENAFYENPMQRIGDPTIEPGNLDEGTTLP